MEQLVARRAHNPEAAGSNPVPATMKNKTVATLPFLFFINKLEGFEAAERCPKLLTKNLQNSNKNDNL